MNREERNRVRRRAMPGRVEASVPVLVVKIGRYPLHHGAVGAIRTLGRLGVPVFAVTENRFTPAAVSRYLHRSFVWPTTGLEDTGFLVEGLLCIGRRIGRPAVLLPTDDEAAVLLAEHSASLAETFRYPWPLDPGLPRRLADKSSLHELCLEHGVASPRTLRPRSVAEVEQAARTARFPLVAKNREPYVRLRSRAVSSTTLVRTPGELRRLAQNWSEDPGVLLQEHLPEADAEDWIVHGYFAADATPRVLFTGVKVRSWPPRGGLTAAAFVANNVELARMTARFCKAVGFSGIADLDWRYDRRDGQYKLLDFNPRVGAQFRLFENEQGIDVVRAQYLDLTGQSVPTGGQLEGRTFILEHVDIPARLAYRRGGYAPPPKPSTKAGTEWAWFAHDDLTPCAAMVAYAGRGGARRLLRRAHDRFTVREGEK